MFFYFDGQLISAEQLQAVRTERFDFQGEVEYITEAIFNSPYRGYILLRGRHKEENANLVRAIASAIMCNQDVMDIEQLGDIYSDIYSKARKE